MRPHTLAARKRLYADAHAIVLREYASPLTIASVARTLSTSPRQLQRVYEQFAARSFHEELIERRLEIAARLLRQRPWLPIREVGRLVGYPHAPHFAHVFGRHRGLTPARYRERELAARRAAAAAAERV